MRQDCGLTFAFLTIPVWSSHIALMRSVKSVAHVRVVSLDSAPVNDNFPIVVKSLPVELRSKVARRAFFLSQIAPVISRAGIACRTRKAFRSTGRNRILPPARTYPIRPAARWPSKQRRLIAKSRAACCRVKTRGANCCCSAMFRSASITLPFHCDVFMPLQEL
jgi:hypothetical protein